MPTEKFTAVAVGHRGNVLGRHEATSVGAAMVHADLALPNSAAITIRGETTSDGSYWGVGRGRVVAVREHGKWVRF